MILDTTLLEIRAPPLIRAPLSDSENFDELIRAPLELSELKNLELIRAPPLHPYSTLQEAFKNSDSAGKSAAGAKILRFRTSKT